MPETEFSTAFTKSVAETTLMKLPTGPVDKAYVERLFVSLSKSLEHSMGWKK
ncbi:MULTISPECIES: hypothetical protein [unclassified Sulfitobacter]|jgi:hypothetical protein|uniref:hypothetical protein n=1 Tax=unclassified Sulfitobacter TaxID=196795 RepID=UPI003746CCCF